MNCNHKIRLESRLVRFFIQTPNHMVGPVMPSAHPPSWPHLTSSKIYLWVTSWYSDISLPLYGLSFSSQPLFQGDFFHEGPFEQPWISWDIEQHSVTSQQQLGLFQTFFLFFIKPLTGCDPTTWTKFQKVIIKWKYFFRDKGEVYGWGWALEWSKWKTVSSVLIVLPVNFQWEHELSGPWGLSGHPGLR